MANVSRDYRDHEGCVVQRRNRNTFQPCFKNPLPLPTWEKEFCTKDGVFKWDKFLEAKRFIHIYPRVMTWDDRAGAEAFKAAKKRFKAHYFRGFSLPSKNNHNIPNLPSPDDCIDDIDWDSEIDPILLEGMNDSVSTWNDEESATCNATQCVVENIPFEEIKPTGWEVEVEVETDPFVGMIVGD